jgi:HEAT repeat protein
MHAHDKHSAYFEPRIEPALKASAYPEDLDTLASGMSDEEALRKIGSRTTTTGKIVTLLMVGGAIGLGYFYVQRNKAYEARMDGLKAAGSLEGEAMHAKLRDILSSTTYDDVKVRAIRNLAHFKDAQAVPQLIAELKRPGIVRAQAASALAAIGSPGADAAKPALLGALPSCDEKDRSQVVWALAVLKESSAADAILEEFVRGIWQKNDDFDPKVITEALGIDKLSEPKLTGHGEKPVRALVAMALSEAASPAVVTALVRMIQKGDEDPEVIKAAVAGLGRAGDPAAAAPLFQLMTGRPEMRPAVLDALAKSTAAPQLATLLAQAKETPTKRELVRLLRKTFDPRSADAFAALLNDADEDIRVDSAQGLAELGDARAVPALVAMAAVDDDDSANDALDALRQLADPSAAEGLLPMLTDEKYMARKAAMMRALGTSHAQAACSALEKELKGDDIGAAAKGLAQVPCDRSYGTLVGMLKRDKKIDFSRPSVVTEMAYRNRFEAIQALGYFGKPDPKAVKELMTIVEDIEDDARLGVTAGSTLGLIADDELYDVLLSKINDTKLDERVRVAYVSGLWRKPSAALSTKLLPLLSGNAPGTIKQSAALAIGYAAVPANDESLIKLLDDANARRYAAMAVTIGGGDMAIKKLLAVLPSDRDAEEILRGAVNSDENDNFNLLLEPMFTSGQVFRRIRAAELLKIGDDNGGSFSYVWQHLATRLAVGWEGPGGVSPRYVRAELYKALTGPDAEKRRVAAAMLVGMNMRGLLLAARDANIKEAREALLSMDRPKTVAL